MLSYQSNLNFIFFINLIKSLLIILLYMILITMLKSIILVSFEMYYLKVKIVKKLYLHLPNHLMLNISTL